MAVETFWTSIQMKRKEQTLETFMMISTWKTTFGLLVYIYIYLIFQRFKC